ncbi:hypothetical protein [Streptomyces sp. NBC_01185]|uniref:hypothetical protein n=1 Tax=Streptomyces sp. NBC_01185 TaxID=2903764 RepID=UPI003870E7E9|nr:hypothetical protein OG770_02200 [Streptomyces sp. NBC_01185]
MYLVGFTLAPHIGLLDQLPFQQIQLGTSRGGKRTSSRTPSRPGPATVVPVTSPIGR